MKNNRGMISFKEYNIILAGDESKSIAGELSKSLDISAVYFVEKKSFPDGEFMITVPREIKGKNVIYIKSTSPPASENVLEVFFTLDTLVRIGAKKTILIMPYFGFARQDKDAEKNSEKGQCISASTILKIIPYLGQNHLEGIYFIDPHFHRTPGKFSLGNIIKKMEDD